MTKGFLKFGRRFNVCSRILFRYTKNLNIFREKIARIYKKNFLDISA